MGVTVTCARSIPAEPSMEINARANHFAQTRLAGAAFGKVDAPDEECSEEKFFIAERLKGFCSCGQDGRRDANSFELYCVRSHCDAIDQLNEAVR